MIPPRSRAAAALALVAKVAAADSIFGVEYGPGTWGAHELDVADLRREKVIGETASRVSIHKRSAVPVPLRVVERRGHLQEQPFEHRKLNL